MKIHLITVGRPKLAYAKSGWTEYWQRLGHYHQLRLTQLADNRANSKAFTSAIGSAYTIALALDGHQFSSLQLADFLEVRALESREVCFLIGGPLGLPEEILTTADYRWSLSRLTFPHDLAMVIVLESLYRAATLSRGVPYHK